SGSIGGPPTPADALEILEAPIVRWLYGRRRPNQSLKLSFGNETGRLYDEWDALGRRPAHGSAREAELATRRRPQGSPTRTLEKTPKPVPFRMLASVLDITTGDQDQTLRILNEATGDGGSIQTVDEVRPRLDLARAW